MAERVQVPVGEFRKGYEEVMATYEGRVTSGDLENRWGRIVELNGGNADEAKLVIRDALKLAFNGPTGVLRPAEIAEVEASGLVASGIVSLDPDAIQGYVAKQLAGADPKKGVDSGGQLDSGKLTDCPTVRPEPTIVGRIKG